MIRVSRVGHVTLESSDLSRAVEHYTDVVGLVATERNTKRAVLSSAMGEELMVIEQGAETRLTNLSFQLDPAVSLGDIQRQLQASGIASEMRRDVTPGLPEVAVLVDPRGTNVELFTQYRIASGGAASAGISPLKLGHVAFSVPSAQAMVEFYTTVFGFRVSDWMNDYFAFLRCGPDHHSLNFVNAEQNRLHHVAFELKDWSHIQTVCELLGQKDKEIIWGPGRHGIGHNIFIYHRDADDHIVEFYIEMDQMKDEALGYFEPRPWHKDRPQRPKIWERIPAALTWGTPPTEDFLRSHVRDMRM